VIRLSKQDLKHKNVPQINAMQLQCERYKLVSEKMQPSPYHPWTYLH